MIPPPYPQIPREFLYLLPAQPGPLYATQGIHDPVEYRQGPIWTEKTITLPLRHSIHYYREP